MYLSDIRFQWADGAELCGDWLLVLIEHMHTHLTQFSII